jgi:hypothetical protein
VGDAACRWQLIVCKPHFDILFRMLKYADATPHFLRLSRGTRPIRSR